ncbi:MAG: hypothetical protein VX768_07630 [Planctomycetota bacterium]|nr:hypothetical protein [Planctomycetota bacterium]
MTRKWIQAVWLFLMVLLVQAGAPAFANDEEVLFAGTGKSDITDYDAGPVNDPLFVKALVLKRGDELAVLLTVDAVAIGEIGRIGNDFLPNLRKQVRQQLKLDPERLLINASHCHGVIRRKGLEDLTIAAIRAAVQGLCPVRVGTGIGKQDQVQENRRLLLKSGKVIDVRHAYSLPPDDEVASAGPIDSDIGICRLDRMDGTTLAVLYNFACHPIQGVPGGKNTADLIGYASRLIETAYSRQAMAFFLQGCGGDINPVDYKDAHHPRHASVPGNRLGISVLAASREIECQPDHRLMFFSETIDLPRGDRSERIRQLEGEKVRLVNSLRGTSLNLKNFMSLMVKYQLSPEYPSANAHRYLQQKLIQSEDLESLDQENLRNMKAYLQNVLTMERITRINTNLDLLKKHQARMVESGSRTVKVEICALQVGDFRLVTFPGELTVQIGLNIKQHAKKKNSFVAGYTNGYVYYCPTAEQMKNSGGAQEDSDCLLAPQWQEIFERRALQMLNRLE